MPDELPLHVLVIEDDPDTRANLCDLLELDHYQVETAATMAEALVGRDWSSILAIILDRKLPDGTAEEILPQLYRRAPEAAVLIVTGYADLNGAIQALRQGAEDYILKPVDADTLRASLARIVQRKRLAEEKRRSEAALRDREARMGAILDTAADGIITIDERGVIESFNRAAERLFGYTAQEAVGQNVSLLMPPPYRQEHASYLTNYLATGHKKIIGTGREVSGLRKDGSVFPLHLAVSEVHLDGNTRLFTGIVRDLTDLQHAQRQMLQSERLAAIGQMAAGLAHESRNALQRSQACLELLMLEVEDRPEALDLLQRIQKAQDHLHQLYNEVRGYAAPLKLECQPCDLAHLWRDVWSHLEVNRNGKQVHLVEQTEGQDLRCQVDPFALGQVFRNLLENALEACPNPGRIVIGCQPAVLGGQAALRVTVTDNGPGIPPQDQDKVFDPFFTTKTKGTGLGMAIARRIVEAHGGQITVTSGSPGGAQFSVIVPRTSRECS